MGLDTIAGVISDMDGVVYRGNVVLPAMTDFFAFLRQRNIPFVLATNNSGRHPEEYVARMAKMGVPDMRQDQFVTSGTATADYLKQQYPAGTCVHVIGRDGLRRMIEEAGLILADDDVSVVIVGIDFEFNYAKARHATMLIRGGADFVGTNPDVTFPAPDGLVPGAGSLIKMIEVASDKTPIIIGKPEHAMFDVAVQRLGVPRERVLMLGDRLNTDILGANRAGLQSALLFTGVSTPAEAEQSTIKPTYIFEDIPALLAAWQIDVE